MEKEKILNFSVCLDTKKDILDSIWKDFYNDKQIVIMNINPEIIINNYKNQKFIDEINSEKYQIPDGIGIVYASKIKHGNIRDRITGIDFMQDILKESVNYQAKIFLYGAKPGIVEKAKEELKIMYKGINIVGLCDGYIEPSEAINKIKESQANILFVGLGNPMQEKFIVENKKELSNIKIFMPVGGSFDVISKTLNRAPIIMQKLNLEWLYRLLKQPKRIFRQVKLLKFILLVIKNHI